MSNLLDDLKAKGLPVISVEPWGESWHVVFADSATEPERNQAMAFISNWQAPPLHDWAAFRLALLSCASYQRITLAVGSKPQGVLLIGRLENAAAMETPPIATIAMLWNMMIQSLPVGAVAVAEIEQWRAIATKANVPLIFSGQGIMSAAPK